MRLLILVLSLCSTLALAQTRDATRGNTPPGMSQDGSGPLDGAVKGGSIQNKDSRTPAAERLKRCDQLNGSLREDCLSKERSAAGGSSAPRNSRNALDKGLTPYGAD